VDADRDDREKAEKGSFRKFNCRR